MISFVIKAIFKHNNHQQKHFNIKYIKIKVIAKIYNSWYNFFRKAKMFYEK